MSAGHGQQLIPWPNRIRDGQYPFDGATQQLALTEPDRHNAIHGLVRHVPWTLVDRGQSSVTQTVTTYPQPGWPGILRSTLTTSVGDDGLTVTLVAENVGDTAVPFGYGVHPYLSAGQDRVDELALTVPAGAYLDVDDRLLPRSVQPVDGTEYDLRSGDALGARVFDTAFTEIGRESDGRWRVRLEHGDRRHRALGRRELRLAADLHRCRSTRRRDRRRTHDLRAGRLQRGTYARLRPSPGAGRILLGRLGDPCPLTPGAAPDRRPSGHLCNPISTRPSPRSATSSSMVRP